MYTFDLLRAEILIKLASLVTESEMVSSGIAKALRYDCIEKARNLVMDAKEPTKTEGRV